MTPPLQRFCRIVDTAKCEFSADDSFEGVNSEGWSYFSFE